MPQPSELPDYSCVGCDLPIADGEPHTDPGTGEDVHATCCPQCT